MSTKAEGPSSPRRFFARIYGHLETKEAEGNDDEDQGGSEPKSNLNLPSDAVSCDRSTSGADTSSDDPSNDTAQVRNCVFLVKEKNNFCFQYRCVNSRYLFM